MSTTDATRPTRRLRLALLAGLAALAGTAAIVPTADAHRTWDADRAAAVNFAMYTDCGRAWDWKCARQLGYTVYPLSAVPYTDHQTTTTVSYFETKLTPWYNTRNCRTYMRMSHGSVVYHSKTC